MRIIKIVFLSFLALSLIACTGLFILFQTFDTDQYLSKLTQQASIALGRPVSIGHVGLGFSFRGISLDAWPLIIADDSAFTSQPFIKIDRVRINLDLRALIAQRKIRVTNILLQSPQIHFIRSQEGNINARSIGQASQFVGENTTVSTSSSSSVRRLSGGVIASSVIASAAKQSFNSITIQDGSISFIDQSRDMPLDIWLSNINVSLSDFSLSKPFQLSFNASPLMLKGIAPGEPDSPISKNITGDLQLNLTNLKIGGPGSIEVNGKLTFTDGIIKDFNIIKTVLSHTLGAFGGVDNIDDLLGGQLKDTVGTNDTVIQKAEAEFSVHDRSISIDNLLIETNLFEFTAKGSMDRDLSMDMQTMLHLNADVSAALIDQLEGLKYLCDDSKRISIDASLKGVYPHLKYKPNKDFRKKSKKMLMEEGGNILGAIFGGRIK